jgi:hypothetical protein
LIGASARERALVARTNQLTVKPMIRTEDMAHLPFGMCIISRDQIAITI